VRSKELFSLEAGGGVERIEDYNSAKSSNQQESDEEAAVYKLTTFNLGRVPSEGGPTALKLKFRERELPASSNP
jgi:hypothetical protein